MNNLLEKLQVIQFFIILFLIKNDDDTKISCNDNKDIDDLKDVIFYREFVKKFIESPESIKENVFLKENEYFYFFYTENLIIYFYKKNNSDKHYIYFDGLSKIKEIATLLIHKLIYKGEDFIKSILSQKGNLFEVSNDYIENINDNKIDIYDVFSHIKSNVYKENLKIKIYGYSLGGPLSQYFYHTLPDKDNIEFEFLGIESWFEGNKELYKDFTDKNLFKNIFNEKSILYFYNKYFQKFNNKNILVNIEEDEKDIINNYFLQFSPLGLINYIKNHHSIINILDKISNEIK